MTVAARVRRVTSQRWVRRTLFLGVIGIAAMIFVALAKSEWAGFAEIALGRHQSALRAKTIEIATIWAKGDPSLQIGAKIAADQLNKAGGVLGKKIVITSYEVPALDEPKMARIVARDTRFVAAIGHTTSDIANLASISYEQTSIVFVAVNATDPLLTRHDGFDFIFRISPTDEEINAVLARAMRNLEQQRSGRIGVLYTRSAHYVMTSYLDQLNGALAAQRAPAPSVERPYSAWLSPPPPNLLTRLSLGRYGYGSAWINHLRASDEMRNAVSRMYDADTPLMAVVLLDDHPVNAGIVIDRIHRSMPASENTIVAGGLGLDRGVWQDAAVQCIDPGTLAAKPIAASRYTVLVATTRCAPFLAKPVTSKGKPLNDYIAWQGYRAVMMIADGMRAAGSIAPIDVAAQFRSGSPVPFTRNGDLQLQTLYLKQIVLNKSRG